MDDEFIKIVHIISVTVVIEKKINNEKNKLDTLNS